MARCPSCDYPLPDDRERVGARCPNCRDPIYEPASRIARPVRAGEPACSVHAGMESVGICLRCGEQVCEVCRTRWRGQILCAACVDSALQTKEATPEQARSHRRAAMRSVFFSGGAWLLSGLALGVLYLAGTEAPVLLTFIVFLILGGDVLLATVGAGQAVSTWRRPPPACCWEGPTSG
jgi:hypothetical protein